MFARKAKENTFSLHTNQQGETNTIKVQAVGTVAAYLTRENLELIAKMVRENGAEFDEWVSMLPKAEDRAARYEVAKAQKAIAEAQAILEKHRPKVIVRKAE